MSLLLLAWPLLVFAAVRWSVPWLGCIALLGMGMQLLWPSLRRGQAWAWLGMGLVAVAGVGVAIHGEARVYLQVLPVLVFCLLALFFGRTLRAGSVPLVTRIAAAARHIPVQEISSLPPELYRYTRRITMIWTFIFICFAAEDLVLLQLALPAHIAVMMNVANFLVLTIFIVAEYLYHSRRYPNPTHRHIGDFLRDILHYDYHQLLDD